MPVIETKALKKYYGKNRGIESVDLCIEKGEIFGFIGPNGAGKSTTIRTLLGFIRATGGEARIMGQPCTDQALARLKKKIGYLPAEVNYYGGMKVKELLHYSAKYYGANAHSRINMLTEYFELETNRPINDLSFGNRKKVGIVQCLLHDPELLIFDEPTGGLDPLMQIKFFDLIKEEHSRGKTVFFSSHILSEVQKICQRVGIIRDGVIIRVESMASLENNQYKKVRILVREGAAPVRLQLKGMEDFQQEGAHISFLYNGSVHELIGELNRLDVENFWAEEPDLEEVFMHYYRKDENENDLVSAGN
ncbi:MAG: ABC transporter ATP-binding protein [Bacillota bacterium]